MRPPKGHDIFIEVAERLPDVEFLIAGGARPQGEDFDFAEEIAANAPENVTITGVLDDDEFPVALAAPDLALLPYRVVSQSGTFNWCAAQELPVLASDEPYFQRIEREWGALETVSLDSPDEVATEVQRLLQNRTALATLQANIRRYKTGNSFESVASRHTDLYRRVLGQVDEPATEITAPSPTPMRAACSAQREQTVSPSD